MKTSAEGLDLIKRFEGLRLKAYRDSGGVLTIGYGHTASVVDGQVITIAQAEDFLKADLKTAEKHVNDLNSAYHWNQNEFDALVSFTFNCGKGNLNLLTAYGKRTKAEIAYKITAYNKCNGKVLQGLVKRREAEKALFLSQEFCVKPLSQISVFYRVRLNYNIRNSPSREGAVVGNTSVNGDLVTIKSLCGEWLETSLGYIHKDAFYDSFK